MYLKRGTSTAQNWCELVAWP